MAFDTVLAARVRAAVLHSPNIEEKKMFGGLAFLSDAHMFVGINDSSLMVRTGPVAYAGALGQSHVREMTFTGRPMTGYVYVDRDGLVTDSQLQVWVDLALSFVQTLPPKKTGKRTRK